MASASGARCASWNSVVPTLSTPSVGAAVGASAAASAGLA
jgi:hypothetical protein